MGSETEGKLAAALREAIEPKTRPCRVAHVIGELDPEDAEALTLAVVNPGVPATTIERAARHNGHSISDSSILRHREQNCTCYVAR